MNIKILDKALNILLAEFLNENYALYVKEEIGRFQSGEIKDFGFQSEASDVIIDITNCGCQVKYNIWDEELEDYIVGEETLEVDFMIKKILDTISEVIDIN